MRTIGLGLFAALALTGCSSEWDMHGEDPVEYYNQHPIKNRVESRDQVFTAHFSTSKSKLAADESERVQKQIETIPMVAVDAVHVNVSPRDFKNSDRRRAIENLLRSAGYRKGDVSFISSPEVADNVADIDVTYLAVVSPECPDWRKSGVTSYSNTGQGNFRCAQEVNFGLMLEDPHDLMHGTGDVETSTSRAALAVQNYNNSIAPAASSGSSGAGASGASGASATGSATATSP